MSQLSVVFDLDGTLLSGDSTSRWVKARIAASGARLAAAVIVAPLALLLMAFACSRRWGASAFLWIASIGQDEDALRRSFAAFADRLNRGEAEIHWRPAGVAALAGHVRQGRRVVVATAAPRWLAEPLLEGLGVTVEVVGSDLGRWSGGWIGVRHCRHEAKCAALEHAGHGRRWAVAYSDSADDMPLLASAEIAHLVNASPSTLAVFARRGVAVDPIAW